MTEASGPRRRRRRKRRRRPSAGPGAPASPPDPSGRVSGGRRNRGGAADGRAAGKRAGTARSRRQARRERSAGGVVVRHAQGRPLVLLIRDSYGHWGFPKGHLERGERADAAAIREVREETGLDAVSVVASIATIDWFFRFRGRLIHKNCEFFLMETAAERTSPQKSEGITACRWATLEEARRLIAYENARGVLLRAHALLADGGSAPPSLSSAER